MRNKIAPLFGVLFVSVMLAGCGTGVKDSVPTSTPSAVTVPAPSATPTVAAPTVEPSPEVEAPIESTKPAASDSEVAVMLENLPVETENNDGYDRDLFNHWVSENSTGCDTRFAVLVTESRTKAVTNGCSVVSGTWVSSYDNVTATDPSGFDIDHMVPLAEAWGSGAYGWDSQTRKNYANDLDYAPALVAVTASSNRSKSDRDPAEWLPDTDACVYVAHWVGVKTRWHLSVDPAEKDKILSVLSFCDEGLTVESAESATVAEGTTSAPAPQAPEAPVAPATGDSDPQFSSCKEAAENGFHGPYVSGQDAEYDWYRDGDKDGMVCE